MSKISELPYLPLGQSSTQPKKEEPGNFARGFKKSMYQIPQTIGGTIGLAGDVLGADGMREYGMGIYENNAKKVEELTRDSDSISSVMEGNGSFSDWLSSGAGYVGGQALSALATGGVGALVGKQLAARGVRHMLGNQVEQEAAKLAISKGAKIGAASAAFGNNLVQEAGSIYPEALQEAQNKGVDLTASDKARVIASSLAAAGVDTLGEALIVNKFLGGGRRAITNSAGEQVNESIARAGLREVPLGMTKEAGTEGVQTAIERYGANQDLSSKDAIRDYVDSAALGALGGAGGGVASSFTKQKLPETGALTRSANAGIDAENATLQTSPQNVGPQPSANLPATQNNPAQQFTGMDQLISAVQNEDNPSLVREIAQRQAQQQIAQPESFEGAPANFNELLQQSNQQREQDRIETRGSWEDAKERAARELVEQDRIEQESRLRLPAPDMPMPEGALIDDNGTLRPQTYQDAAASQVAAAQREELGQPVPYGARGGIENVNVPSTSPAPEAPSVILHPSGKPFTTKIGAQSRLKQLGGNHVVVPVEGGFAIHNKDVESNTAIEPKDVTSSDLPQAVQPQVNEIQPGDIMLPSGKPFKVKYPAIMTQRQSGGEIIEVDGGFIVRPPKQPSLEEIVAESQSVPDYEKGKTGAETARNKLNAENPFLSFLGKHGLNIDERSDVGGERGKARLIPGHGPLFRKNGLRLDELAKMAQEAGFLSQQQIDNDTDNGGVNALSDMIGLALNNEVVPKVQTEPEVNPDLEMLNEATRVGLDVTGKTPDQVYDMIKEYHSQAQSAVMPKPQLVSVDSATIGPANKDYESKIVAPAREAVKSNNATKVDLKDGSSVHLVNMEDGDGVRTIVAVSDAGDVVGSLGYSTVPGFNPDVYVEDSFQRQGVATAMYDLAESTGGVIPPIDAGNAVRTESGAAFRNARAGMPTSKVQNDKPSTPKRSPEEINIELQKLTDAVRERTKNFDLSFDDGNDINFMTPEEKSYRHELLSQLPSSGEEQLQAKKRVEEKIAAKREAKATDGGQSDSEQEWNTAVDLFNDLSLEAQELAREYNLHELYFDIEELENAETNDTGSQGQASEPVTGGTIQTEEVNRSDNETTSKQAERVDAVEAGNQEAIDKQSVLKPTDPDTTSVNSVAPSMETASNEKATSEPVQKEASKPIADFGEKIGGAKKDVWSGFKDKMDEAKGLDIASEPLSKSWPEPNYQALLDNGADQWAVGFMHAARDAVPRKPTKSYKLKSWVSGVEMLRNFAADIADGTISVDKVKSEIRILAATHSQFQFLDLLNRIELYQAVGHSKSLADVRISYGEYAMLNGVEYKPSKIIWTVEKKAASTAFSNFPQQLAQGNTKQAAIEDFKAKFANMEIAKPASKEVTFDVFSERGKPGFFVGKKIGRNFVTLAGPFDTVKEARSHRNDNQDQLVTKLEKAKEIPSERRDTNNPRVGEDMREGKDVTPEMFSNAFGFRGVEFGNYVEQSKRQADLNEAYDALMDMAALLGIPPKSISLNGTLGLAFGARGSGGKQAAAAHYESNKVVINLTKKSGAGSLGHEWWHALDNYFSRMAQKPGSFMTERLDVNLSGKGSNYIYRDEGVRKEMIDAFGAVMKSIRSTAIKARSSKLDGKRTKEYWTTDVEMSARAFESYLISKLQDNNASNDYLANIVGADTWAAAEKIGFELDDSYPYPTAGEIPAIRAGFDHLFSVIESKETDQGTALFSREGGQRSKFGFDVDELQPIVDQISSTWKNAPKINIVQTIDDLPFDAPSDARGAYFKKQVYLVAANLRDQAQAEAVLLHETLGHAGLNELFGEKLAPALRSIAMKNRKIAEAAAVWRKGNTDIKGKMSDDRYHLVSIEEALADYVGTGRTINGVEKLLAAIQKGLRAIGLNSVADWMENATDAEVLSMLASARKHIEKGSEFSVFGEQQAQAFSRDEKALLSTDTEKSSFLNGAPIAKLNSADAPMGGYKEVQKWAADIFASQGGIAHRSEVGEITLDERAAKSSMAHGGANKYKKIAFVAVKDVIEKGVLVLKSEYRGEESFYFSAPIMIDGNINIETVLVRRDANTKRMYLHSVTTIGSLLNQRVSSADQENLVERSGSTNAGDITTVLQKLINFNIDQANEDEKGLDAKLSRSITTGDNNRTRTQEQLRAFENVGRTVQAPTLKERFNKLTENLGKKLAQGIVDQFAPIKDLSAEAYGLMRLSKGASGAFEAMLKGGQLKLSDGVYDFDDTKRGGVIDRLLVPLQGEADDFMWWVAGNRAESLTAQGKEHLFTADDIKAFKSLSDGQASFDYTIQHGLQKGKTTRDRAIIYADSLKTFNEFNKNTLDMAEQSGLIDPESRKIWESEFYIPFYRVSEESDDGVRGMNIKSGVVRQQAFKKLKGGTDKLNSDLLENTLMNWAHLLDASAKNRAAKSTLEAAENIGAAIPAMSGDKKTVWYMDGGEKKYFAVEDAHLLAAIQGLEYAGMRSPIMNAMSTMKHAMTVGVTASPFFKIRNLIRDSVSAIGIAGLDYNPAKNIKEGWKLTDPKSDDYFRLLAGGGTIHFGSMLEGSEAKRIRKLVESGVDESTILNSDSAMKSFYRKHVAPAVDAYNELGNRGESINRASLYDQLIKQGKSHAEASLLARDLMDFSMQGAWTSIRFLTQVVPFMNARLQGLYKLGRSAKEDPKRFGTVLGAVSVASIALMLAYSDDDDWKKREDWDRDNFWWFKIGGTAFRIPKPFEIGAIGTLAERGIEYFTQDEMTGDRFIGRFKHLMLDSLSMNPIPQMIKPVIDVYANKDSFTGRPIETMSMERLRADYRFNGSTSMAARGLSTAGNSVTGDNFLSPVQIDHLIRGYFGWLGAFAVGSADRIVRPFSGEPEKATPDYAKWLSGGMVADTKTASSRYVSQMYEQAKALDEAYGTWRMLIKTGKVEEAKEFAEENADKLHRYKGLQNVKKQATSLNEQVRVIERSNLDPDEKREKINLIQQRKDNIARRASL